MKSYRIELINGCLIFLALGAYFLIIDAFGLADVFYLRLLNVLIVFYGVNRSIKQHLSQGEFSYLPNLASGFMTSILGVFLSVIGLAIYVKFIRGEMYMLTLADSLFVSAQPTNLIQFCVGILMEGVASSVIASFVIMQRWKNVHSISEAEAPFI